MALIFVVVIFGPENLSAGYMVAARMPFTISSVAFVFIAINRSNFLNLDILTLCLEIR